jgi:MFS family permease
VALATLGEMIFAPISKTFASTFLGSGNEGVGFAIWKISYYLSGVFGASVSGYIGHYYGHQKAWSICALLLLCVIIYYLFYSAQKGVLGLVNREATIKG